LCFVFFIPRYRPLTSFQVIPCRRHLVQDFDYQYFCRPEVSFWQGLLDGFSFPDLKILHIDHQPISEADQKYRGFLLREPIDVGPDDLKAVKQLTMLNVFNCPELNDSAFIAMLPWVDGLTTLRLLNNPALTYKS
jgi:hypothetical protein